MGKLQRSLPQPALASASALKRRLRPVPKEVLSAGPLNPRLHARKLTWIVHFAVPPGQASEFSGSVVHGQRQCPNAGNAQVNGAVRMLHRHMHESWGRPAVIALGPFVRIKMYKHGAAFSGSIVARKDSVQAVTALLLPAIPMSSAALDATNLRFV